MGVFVMQISATIRKKSGRENRLTGILCAAAISMALSGCEGQTQGAGSKGYEHEYEHELAAVQPLSATDITTVQRQLSALGYDAGPVDGVLGKRTEIAIKHFQVDAEMNVDGKLTASFIFHLKERHAEHQAWQARATPKKGNLAGESGNASISLAAVGPSYEVGDTYVYTDGQVETVSRVGTERTLWESAGDSVYTTYRNFILPPISWKSGATRVENQIQPIDGTKWPPATSEDVVFSVVSKTGSDPVANPGTWSGKWRCEAKGVSPVKAIAGQFDALVIECHRAKPEPGTWKKRTWYYVQEVGHYVRRIDLIHGTGQKLTVDLVAVRPGGKGWPPAARGGLDWAIQGALDAGDYENTVEWRSSAVGAMFNIRLEGDVPSSGKVDCRRYSIKRTGPEQVRIFPAIACKTPGAERWLIPGLDPDSVSPLALKP
jgi:peptidoglycan hydrolase-like protein with peptidoglycan-binding domain